MKTITDYLASRPELLSAMNCTPGKSPGDDLVEGDTFCIVYDTESQTTVTEEYHEFFTPPPVAVVLDAAEWREYAYRQLGAILAPAGDDAQKDAAGLTRYGGILKDGRASTDDTVIAAFDQYDDALRFRQDKVTIFLSVLLIAGILTQAEFDAIINNWPLV